MGHFTQTDDPGIDYSMGTLNYDKKTGIHFGVINMNALDPWAWESLESDYGDPACPICGNAVKDYSEAVEEIEANPREDGLSSESQLENYTEGSCADYVCLGCEIILGSDEVTGDEPCGHKLDEDGYEGSVDSYNDLVLLKSPYYTHAQFCSPCVPGAGHLEYPCFSQEQFRFPRSKKARIRKKWAKKPKNYRRVPVGPKTYCLGHDWFEGDKAPYPVFDVKTGKEVPP